MGVRKPKIPKSPEAIGKKILIAGGLGLVGLTASRMILPRLVPDNTIWSAAAKGIAAVAFAPVSPEASVGIAIDGADDLKTVFLGGGTGGQGTSTGRFI